MDTKEIFTRLPKGSVTLQPMKDNRKDCLWYNGNVLAVPYKNGSTMVLSANGGIVADLYKNGELIASINDKDGKGGFSAIMGPYISSDEELERAMDAEEDADIYLEVQNNNWWEVCIVDGSFYEDPVVLCSTQYDEALDEMLNTF